MLKANVTSLDLCAGCLRDASLVEMLSPRRLVQSNERIRVGQSFYLLLDVAVVPHAHCQNCHSTPPPPVADETGPPVSAPQLDSVPVSSPPHLSPIVFLAGNLERDRQFHQT